jgi:MscS family membrane protein
VLLLLLTVDFTLRRLLARLKARAALTAGHWDDALLHAVSGPLSALLWSSGLLGVLALARRHLGWDWLERIGAAWSMLLIAALAWFLLRLIAGFERSLVEGRLRRGEYVDVSTVDAVAKLLRVVVLVVTALAALQTLGVGIAGILAAGGVGGVAVGFAARDLLANFFGGLTVYLDRPFAVGDWIRTLDNQIEGTVEHIGWRSTVVRTFDKRPIYVPNALFTTLAVENPSRMTHRRIREWVGVRYDDLAKIGAMRDALAAALVGDPDIDAAEGVFVNLDRYGPSSVDLLIVCFTRRCDFGDFQAVKERVLLHVARIVAAHGAAIAFPTQVLKLEGHLPERES